METYLYDKSVEFSRDNKSNFLLFPIEIREKLLNLLPKWEKYLSNLKITFEETKSIKSNKHFDKLINIDKKKFVFLQIIDYLELKGNKNKDHKHDKNIGKCCYVY